MIWLRAGTRLVGRGTIPAFLSVDVEPDRFQIPAGHPGGWRGYGATVELIDQLRTRLAERVGTRPRFGWYFRTDPQIAEVYGRPDHALTEFSTRVGQLQSEGDYVGVHAHPLRWSENRRLWVHDFADTEWLVHCTRFALEAHARWAGASPRRFRAGAGFLRNEIIETIDRAGVAVDLSLEPVAGWGLTASDVSAGADSSPMIGAYTDCGSAPLLPYRPAHHDFRVAGGKRGRRLLMVPLSTSTPLPEEPARWRIGRRPPRQPRGPVQMLYPSVEWPSERYYWDLVERQLHSMRRPYLSLSIRTDVADSTQATRVRRLFETLPQHPVAERLRFVDPLAVASRLAS